MLDAMTDLAFGLMGCAVGAMGVAYTHWLPRELSRAREHARRPEVIDRTMQRRSFRFGLRVVRLCSWAGMALGFAWLVATAV